MEHIVLRKKEAPSALAVSSLTEVKQEYEAALAELIVKRQELDNLVDQLRDAVQEFKDRGYLNESS